MLVVTRKIKMPVDYIRHSQSTFDANTLLRDKDAPLTHAGIHQAATALAGNYDVIICSPLMCARQTVAFSKIVAGQTQFSDMVREIMDGNEAYLRANDSGGQIESKDEVTARIHQLHGRVAELRSQGKSVLVVSHHNFLQQFLGVSLTPGAGITTLP